MDIFGEKLKTSREQRGYSLEQVARDTNIAKKYLIALEEEDFAIFPGDPYLIGFLTNYSEYLGLDPAEMVSLYRNMKLQEQPAPISELLNNEKSKFPAVLLISLLVAVVGVGGYLFYRHYTDKTPVVSEIKASANAVDVNNTYSYDLAVTDIEDRFPESSELQIKILKTVFNITIKKVTSTVVLGLPDGDLILNLGDEKAVDLNDDGLPDISITVNDIDSGNKSVLIKLRDMGKTGESNNLENSVVTVPPDALDKQNAIIIMNAPAPKQYVLDVIFRGNALVRYRADGGERIEQYFDKGETFRLDVNKEIMLWISNAGSLMAKISGVEISFGRSGEVASYLIKWNKNTDSGEYELQMIPVS